MKIGTLDTNSRVLIVAEIGNNHEGNFALAQRLIELAAQTGVDGVKFQTFRTELFVSRKDSSRFDRLKSFELSFEQFAQLRDRARARGLLFLSTPLDLESAAFLSGVVDAYKVASGDNTFYPLIDYIAGTGKPMVLSTGLIDMDQIFEIRRRIERVWKDRVPACN